MPTKKYNTYFLLLCQKWVNGALEKDCNTGYRRTSLYVPNDF